MNDVLPVEIYMARWLRLGQQLARVNKTLSWWDEWRANEYLPPGQKCDIPKPAVGHGEAKDIQAMLVDELGRLVENFVGRN